MVTYVALMFNASLKEDTPDVVVDSLKYMMGTGPKPASFPFLVGKYGGLFHRDQRRCYFGIQKAVSKMWYDGIGQTWILSVECNIKNYCNEIGSFLAWIKPHIKQGNSLGNMYATVECEGEDRPRIYCCDN